MINVTFPFQFSFPPHNLVSIFLVSKLFSTQLFLPPFLPFSFSFTQLPPPISSIHPNKIKIFSNQSPIHLLLPFSPSHRAFRFQPLKKKRGAAAALPSNKGGQQQVSKFARASPAAAGVQRLARIPRRIAIEARRVSFGRIVGHYAPTKLTPVSR